MPPAGTGEAGEAACAPHFERRCSGSSRLLHWLFGSAAKDNIDHIAQELLVSDAVGGVGWEFHFGLKMRRQLSEQLDPRDRVELIAAQQSLQRHRCLSGRDALTESRRQ